MECLSLINNRKILANQVMQYINSHEEIRQMSAIDIFNQFTKDMNILVTNEESASWLLEHIYDIKKLDMTIFN